MKLYIKNLKGRDCACDVLILPLTEGRPDVLGVLGLSAQTPARKISPGDFSGRQNEVLLLPAPDGIKPDRILLAGLGPGDEVSPERVRQAGGKAATYLQERRVNRIALHSAPASLSGYDPLDFIEGALLGLYTFTKYRSEKKTGSVKSITMLSKPSQKLRDKMKRVQVIADSVCYARDLVNTPSNDMTPRDMAREAKTLAKKNLRARILGKRDVRKLGMEAFLSVAKGSDEPPRFIVLDYRGAAGLPVVIIGKAVTFDSGGLSLKPAEGMEKMKYDMAGGAAVLGVMKAVSELELPLHVIGIIPSAENLPGGSATRPGDVITSYSGKTIEITNIDAEGRLIIADAIGYAKKFNPRSIIDIATLTGACSIALGNEAIAIMGNRKSLIDAFKKASERTHERVWEMPLFEEYKEYLKSDIADIKNNAGRNGSLVTSAYFLYEFAGQVPWAHLDIAGTAWIEKEKPYIPKGASGIGVRLILDALQELS